MEDLVRVRGGMVETDEAPLSYCGSIKTVLFRERDGCAWCTRPFFKKIQVDFTIY